MIRRKNLMHKSHYILGNETMKQEYKKYSNKLTKIKSTAKKQYYAKELEANAGNPRKTWGELRTILPGNSTKSSSLPSAVDLNGSKVTNQQITLREFNNFFSTIRKKSTDKFSDSKTYKRFLRNRISSTVYMEPPRTNEVLNVINSLNFHKSVSHDNISSYFLRLASSNLALAICFFIDNAFRIRIFPHSYEIARVIPLFKSGKIDNLTNYRSISILTCFLKIF